MDVRISNGKSAVERISVVARTLSYNMHLKFNRIPDYADFQAALEPYIRRELLLARIDEVRSIAASMSTARIVELNQQLIEVEISMPDQDKL